MKLPHPETWMITDTHSERRSWLRFRTALPVLIESQLHGAMRCVARNVSKGGLCVELHEPLPLGTAISVWFIAPDGTRIGAAGVVKNHYIFNYFCDQKQRQVRGMGVRFTGFEPDSEGKLRDSLGRLRTLH